MEVQRTALQRAQRLLLFVLAGLLLVLVATGLWLTFRYQPSGSFPGARPESWIRVCHRVTSTVLVVVGLLVFGISIAVSYERRLRGGLPAWVPGVVLFLGAGTASLSGYLLPWDQLALWAPDRPTKVAIGGYGFLFNRPEVSFILIGSSEVSKSSLRQWFLFHTVAFPIALVILGAVLFRVTRRARLLPPERDGEVPAPSPS